MKTKYSGKKSRKFWDQVNKLDGAYHQEVYSLGVALQNLEGYVLEQLKSAKQQKP